MTTWTTIPPWLYQNDLPDDELQERYVAAAERKLAERIADRAALEREIAALRATPRAGRPEGEWRALAEALAERYAWLGDAVQVEHSARALLQHARAALAAYRSRRGG